MMTLIIDNMTEKRFVDMKSSEDNLKERAYHILELVDDYIARNEAARSDSAAALAASSGGQQAPAEAGSQPEPLSPAPLPTPATPRAQAGVRVNRGPDMSRLLGLPSQPGSPPGSNVDPASQQQQQQQGEGNRMSGKKKIAIGISCVAFIAIAGTLVYILILKKKNLE